MLIIITNNINNNVINNNIKEESVFHIVTKVKISSLEQIFVANFTWVR